MCNSWPAGPKLAWELNFCDPRQGTDFQASVAVFQRYFHGRIKGTVDLRLNRYFVKSDEFYCKFGNCCDKNNQKEN